jgi:23S rRNA (guanine1835-N2)-methyltransferase
LTDSLDIGGHRFHLARWPLRPDDPHRAWDAADVYLHDHLAALEEAGDVDAAARPLVINDNFGALAVPLRRRAPVSWSDDHLARLALAHNLRAAGDDEHAVAFVPADTTPASDAPFAVAVARFPKSLAFWEDTLRRLRPLLAPGARVLAGGMIKHTPMRAYRLLEEIIGPTATTEGRRKARLAVAVLDPHRDVAGAVPDARYRVDEADLDLAAGPNVFARDRLDVGTRVLLPHLPRDLGPGRAADLGCGAGVLALALARANPDAEVLGVDVSYQAVASARANAAANGLASPRLVFEAADGLTGVAAESLDLVVCNPPFHQDRTVGDQLAWGMFAHAHRCLRPGGRLIIVGNRHLGHGGRLVRLFGDCRVLDATPKFEVLAARRADRGAPPVV